MTTRIWRRIKGHPNYSVSNTGLVKNVITGLILSINHFRSGYRSVTLDGVAIKIHRLVAITFVPNDDPENKTVVDHIDANRLNNNASNLEWVTLTENTRRGYITGKNRVTKKGVIQYDLNGNELARFESLKEASKKTGVHDTSIAKVCTGERKTAKGYVWKYINPQPKFSDNDIADCVEIKKFPTSLISPSGKIYSKFNKRPRITQINSDGYEQISLAYNGYKKTELVHRLVAKHFIPKISEKNLVNHIDGNKLHNYKANLEWVNNSENLLHAYKMKRAKTKKIKKDASDSEIENKPIKKPVILIEKNDFDKKIVKSSTIVIKKMIQKNL